jgi:hypothetical protein
MIAAGERSSAGLTGCGEVGELISDAPSSFF